MFFYGGPDSNRQINRLKSKARSEDSDEQYCSESQTSRWECVNKGQVSHFLTEAYVVGTQKNHLDETALLSTQNTWLNWCIRK